MSDSPKGRNEALALLLVPVVPDGAPRTTLDARALEPAAPPHADAAIWFDDPDTRYLMH